MRTIKSVILLAALAAVTHSSSAGPAGLTESNFHTVNELGGYHFGYNDGRTARQEERSQEGVVRGAYKYVDADGKIQTVTYTADKHNGFLASGTNIPRIGRIPEVGEVGEIIEKTPSAITPDTPEVAAARAKHLEVVRRIQLGEDVSAPVEYTTEVAAARADHFNKYNIDVLARSGQLPTTYISPLAVQHIAGTQYHPDYLPYVSL